VFSSFLFLSFTGFLITLQLLRSLSRFTYPDVCRQKSDAFSSLIRHRLSSATPSRVRFPFSLVIDLPFGKTSVVLSVFYYIHHAFFVKGFCKISLAQFSAARFQGSAALSSAAGKIIRTLIKESRDSPGQF
jgi:hypothetical protein